MTRVLAVLEQGARLPSGHIRGLIYRDILARRGFDVRFVARQAPPWPLRMLSLGNRFQRLRTWMAERRILRLARQADVVYLQKVASLRLMRGLRRVSKARVIYDVCDAGWLAPPRERDEFDEILRSADAVTTDNEITAQYVRRHNAACTVVPDPAQVEDFDRRRAALARKPSDRFVLGWLGSPHTAFNLYVVWDALETLFRRHPNLHLRLVGTGYDPAVIPPFENVRYSCRAAYDRESMIEEVFGMHVGLFPLQDVERCRVRGINKAALYMSGEAVVVASPVGQVAEFLRDGVNGFTARSTGEWIERIEALLGDDALRRRVAATALAAIQRGFRVEDSFAALEPVLRP
jgi:glycosyltransferase involved in cell wall biosynthesis